MAYPTARRVQTDTRSLRQGIVDRLLYLQQRGELTTEHLKTTAAANGVHRRTVNRWLQNAAENDGVLTPHPRPAFCLTPLMIDTLARLCGNTAAAYRELAREGHLGEQPPSYVTFYRATRTALTPGLLAGLRGGEAARCRHDVYNERPRGFRNQAWEGDHVEASVFVNHQGRRIKPWITWFIDAATNVVLGLSVSAHAPSRESILVALRDAILIDEHHGPCGGLPGLIRIDGGQDFRSDTVAEALGKFGVRRVDLPPRCPEHKGTVEALNSAVKVMHFSSLPGFTQAPDTGYGRSRIDPDEQLLTFEAFVGELKKWVLSWNTEHRSRALGNRTPLQAWQEDLTLIYHIDPATLHTYTMERVGGLRTINSNGIHWGNRHYIAPWMQGKGGTKVHLRYMPHHHHEIHAYDREGKYLGPATQQNQTSPEQQAEITRGRRRDKERAKYAYNKAKKQRVERFAATTTPTAPQALTPMTDVQATEEINGRRHRGSATEALPALLPPPQATSSWRKETATQDQSQTCPAPTPPQGPLLPPEPSASWHHSDLSSGGPQ